MKELGEDQLIRADFLPSAARVKKYEQRPGYTLLEVVLDGSGEFRSLRLTADQLAQIEVVDGAEGSSFVDPERFFLFIEANRIRLAYQFDPHFAVSVSQVDPLPHQIEAVYHHALEMPRLRFLIADDPGSGKTIMAGLIIKELQYRGLAKRILIVAPGHLKYQWQRELKEKFNTKFRLVDRNTMRAAWGENVWEENPLAITSIDFLKQDDVKASLSSSMWDLVVVDEAHKMSAYAYETKERTKIDKTKRYMVGEVLSKQAEHFLFLTATPHRGDEENFRLFLDLLRPGFFAKIELLEESVERQENPLFIRRLKEDMKTFDGKDIFPPRHVLTVRFRMTDQEVDLYNQVTHYVRNYFDQAKENRNIAFAMVILQRRLTSSTNAILSSLQRRHDRLKDLLILPEKLRSDGTIESLKTLSDEDLEDLPEDERWAIEEKLENLTIANNIDDVRAEIEQLEGLIEQAKQVRAQEIESKLIKLRDEILANLDGRKLLIFTEHKDTLTYLEEKLRGWGYKINVIHGSMDLDSRIEAERIFRNETQIMVATEAAGEGINLQFCSLMVNYDIPWNPNRLEQRMGRVHRYGQDKEVFVWNLVSKDTREGQILDRLFTKLEKMRKALGTDRVYDIIGDIIPGTDLSGILRDAVFHQQSMEELESVIDRVDEDQARLTLESVFLRSLASRHIDISGLHRESLEAEEGRLVPAYVQDYFLRAFERVGGKYSRIEYGFRIDSVPYELRRWNEDYDFKIQYGEVLRQYRRITFDKKIARSHSDYELIAPGHPLVEAVNEAALILASESSGAMAIFHDPEGLREGVLWFIEGVIRDGFGKAAGRRVFCLMQDRDGRIEKVNPAILWDVEPARSIHELQDNDDNVGDQGEIEDYVVEQILFPYREDVLQRRSRDAEIKEKYGLRSLEFLIQESNGKLLDYDARAAQGVSMEIAILNERRKLEQLIDRQEALKAEIRLERSLAIDEPRLLGKVLLVRSAADAKNSDGEDQDREIHNGKETYSTDEMVSDPEIEAVGMRVAMDYETQNGRDVEDVSKEKHGGFDLRSMKFDEHGRLETIRYIEVKARARSGAIRLTANEWKKARHFGADYWIYIVTNAGTADPELTNIQNPAARFHEGENIFATGFIVSEKDWRMHPVEAEGIDP